MQIQFTQIIKVIFVLSTIVAVTDCCSSRVLLLREHRLKIVQHNHLHEHAHELQQNIEQRVVELIHQQLESQQAASAFASSEEKPLEEFQQLDGHQVADGFTATEEKSLEVWQQQPASTATSTEQSLESSWSTDDTSTTMATATGEPPPGDSSSSTVQPSAPELYTEPTFNANEGSTLPATTTTSKVYLPNYENSGLPCLEDHKTEFCLNGGSCSRYLMTANHSLFSCVCNIGYYGERCEFKNNAHYVPKVQVARIVFSFPMLILLSTIYIVFGAIFILRVPQKRRQQQQLSLQKQRLFVGC